MKYAIIFITAILLFIIFAPIGLLYALIRGTWGGSFWGYMLDCAIGINQAGNVAMKYLFNDTMIKAKGKLFGNPNETISHVLGVNKINNHLLFMGKALAWVLNKIDPNHVEKAANNRQ